MSRSAEPKAAAKQVVLSLETAARLHHGEGELGFDFEHIDWKSGMRLESLTPSEIFNAETMHELASNRDQLEYIAQLIRALGSSVTDLLNRYERYLDPYYAKMSRGFASLPDELLALIFKYAACSQEEGTNYVFYLSQVSRRFRRISLSDKSLWCYLLFRHNAKLQKIARSVDNCGSNCDLHIIIKDDKMVDTCLLKNFMEKCSPFASRLCSISLFGDWCDAWEYEYRYYTLAGTINQLLSCPLFMPRLRELNLTQSRHHDPDDRNHIVWISSKDIVENISWTAPNLHILRCDGYIPPPSFPFKTITFFSLKLNLLSAFRDATIEQNVALREFLPTMPNISEINLELTNEFDCDKFPIGSPGTLDLPVLTSLRIHVKDFSLPFEAKWVLTSFMKSLRMPNLGRLAVHLEWQQLRTYLSPLLLSQELPRFVEALTPKPNFHQALKHYSVTLSHPPFKDDLSSELRDREKSIDLKIPLERLPYVTVLEVTTYGSLHFVMVDPVEASVRPSQLRELHLTACQNMDEQHLRDAIQSLYSIGAGNMLERVLIRDCDLLDDGIVEAVMGKSC